MVNVMFNNPLMFVVDYPAQDVVEILDKRSGRVGVFSGALAQRFRHDFGILVAEEADEDRFEDFMETYEAVITQTARLH